MTVTYKDLAAKMSDIEIVATCQHDFCSMHNVA